MSLRPNTYRVRHLRDNDDGYSYGIGPEMHAGGGYEIELVVQKIAPPAWELAGSADPEQAALEKARDAEISQLIGERDVLARECTRWFDAAILARAEHIAGTPGRRRARRFRGLVRLFRSDSAAAAAVADRAWEKGEWERAARFYLDALAEDPTAPELWRKLGNSLKSAGRYPEAEFAHVRAAALASA